MGTFLSWSIRIYSGAWWLTRLTVLVISTGILLASCKNTGQTRSQIGSKTEILVQPQQSLIDDSQFVLKTVVPSQSGGAGLFDFIGENQEFRNYCTTNTDCQCKYSYVQNGATTSHQSPVVYSEANLVRCAAVFGSGVNTVDVRVETVDAASKSNAITIELQSAAFASATQYLDFSKESSFLPVQRYQCRSRLFVSNPLDPAMIDVAQSEDPAVAMPLNFYTTSPAQSLLAFQRLGEAGMNWECSLGADQIPAWANPSLYTDAACTDDFCSADGNFIVPPNTFSKNRIDTGVTPAKGRSARASFALAKAAYAPFVVAVRGAIAPNSLVTPTVDVLGYGVAPIPGANGTTSCPNTALPAGARWVKLWAYRATNLSTPRVVSQSLSTQNWAVGCAPEAMSIPSCDKPVDGANNGAGIVRLNQDLVPGNAASRVLIPATNGNANTMACFNVNRSPGSTFDHWAGSNFGFSMGCDGGMTLGMVQGIGFGIYREVVSSSITGSNPCASQLRRGGSPSTPFEVFVRPADSQLTTIPVESSQSNLTDYLFMVTPVEVNDTSVRNGLAPMYRPVSYRTLKACDPSTVTDPLQCPTAEKVIWDINSGQIGEPAGASAYPVCVVQFTGEDS